MTAKFETAENLLAALAWQHDMGIDEVICDDPATGVAVSLRDLSAGERIPAPQAGQPVVLGCVHPQTGHAKKLPRLLQDRHK